MDYERWNVAGNSKPFRRSTTPPSRASARAELHDIARMQRAIIYCILAQIVGLFGQYLVPDGWRWVLALVYLMAALMAFQFAFLLSTSVFSIGLGIVLGLLTLVPVIALIPLLIMNNKTTKILRQHGIRVGLMGADMKQFPPSEQTTIP